MDCHGIYKFRKKKKEIKIKKKEGKLQYLSLFHLKHDNLFHLSISYILLLGLIVTKLCSDCSAMTWDSNFS